MLQSEYALLWKANAAIHQNRPRARLTSWGVPFTHSLRPGDGQRAKDREERSGNAPCWRPVLLEQADPADQFRERQSIDGRNTVWQLVG